MNISMRLAVIAAGAVAAASLAATAPSAQTSPGGQVRLYDIVYYSDSTKTVEVGRNLGVCYGGWGQPIWAGSSEYTGGQTTPYASNEHVGWCTDDGPVYF